MKLFRSSLSVLALLLVGSSAYAQVISVITVDENGNGTQKTVGVSFPLPSFMGPDIGPGGLNPSLHYSFNSPPIVEGDVVLIEPGGAQISDIIRFNNVVTNLGFGEIVFYSDNSDGVDALADTGFPTAFYTNALTINEVGPEGDNGVFYTPADGQPGSFVGLPGVVTYHFISDSQSVPEPGTAALICGLGVPALALFPRRRK
jgi:hypothetical protein